MVMTKKDIKEFIRQMSYSQGFYSRLYRDLDEEAYEYLASQKFDTNLDLVMFLEG